MTSLSRASLCGSGDAGNAESVALRFAKVDLEYKPQKADGSFDAGIHFKYDIKANKVGLIAASAFVARITSPATGAPDSIRSSACAISRHQSAPVEQPFDVRARMAIAAVQLEPIAERRVPAYACPPA